MCCVIFELVIFDCPGIKMNKGQQIPDQCVCEGVLSANLKQALTGTVHLQVFGAGSMF